MRRVWSIGVSACVLGMLASSAAAELPGLKLDGTRWTYREGDFAMDGILIKPDGDGPFPAVLISHGLGGSAESFGANKAREMAGWGVVCIAPNYTHSRNNLPQRGAGDRRLPAGGDRQNYGASDENIQRAARCLDILASLPYVDTKRIAAYGHSMGGFVTIGLAAREPKRLAAAAISGSGIAPREGYAAPSSEVAEKVRTPLIMFHGSLDTTVRPEASASLEEVLKKSKVETARHVYEGVGHPVDQQRSAEVFRLMKEWFQKHGAL